MSTIEALFSPCVPTPSPATSSKGNHQVNYENHRRVLPILDFNETCTQCTLCALCFFAPHFFSFTFLFFFLFLHLTSQPPALLLLPLHLCWKCCAQSHQRPPYCQIYWQFICHICSCFELRWGNCGQKFFTKIVWWCSPLVYFLPKCGF